MKIVEFSILLILVTASASAEEKSPITSHMISNDESPAAVAAAGEHGAATASKDIAAGTLRILLYGMPPVTIVTHPLDPSTGYRLLIVGDCVVSGPFRAEVDAYNKTMREHYAASRVRAPTTPAAGPR